MSVILTIGAHTPTLSKLETDHHDDPGFALCCAQGLCPYRFPQFLLFCAAGRLGFPAAQNGLVRGVPPRKGAEAVKKLKSRVLSTI